MCTAKVLYIHDSMDGGYIPMEWYASDGGQLLVCPEPDCEEGIPASKTEWQAAENYNRIYSSIRLAYCCPACKAHMVSFQVASNHIVAKRTDQGHIEHGVHVQVGTRHMVSIESNRWYKPPVCTGPHSLVKCEGV